MKTIKLSKGRWNLLPRSKKVNIFGAHFVLRKTKDGNQFLPVKIIA